MLRKIEQKAVRVYITQEILTEIEDVIERPKFRAITKKAGLRSEEIMQKIVSLSHAISAPDLKIKLCRDEKDNKFLECGVHAKANYIVTGDQDLLSLKKYENISIVRTAKILCLLE